MKIKVNLFLVLRGVMALLSITALGFLGGAGIKEGSESVYAFMGFGQFFGGLAIMAIFVFVFALVVLLLTAGSIVAEILGPECKDEKIQALLPQIVRYLVLGAAGLAFVNAILCFCFSSPLPQSQGTGWGAIMAGLMELFLSFVGVGAYLSSLSKPQFAALVAPVKKLLADAGSSSPKALPESKPNPTAPASPSSVKPQADQPQDIQPKADMNQVLAQLKSWKEAEKGGVITEAEYNRIKAGLLAQLNVPQALPESKPAPEAPKPVETPKASKAPKPDEEPKPSEPTKPVENVTVEVVDKPVKPTETSNPNKDSNK